MTERQELKQPKNQYFHIMLNMADDDLDVYEYRLLGHYIRVGVTFEGTRTTAKKTRMSLGKVVSTRNKLEEKGYIRMDKPDNHSDTVTITIIDRMAENVARYSKERSQDEHPVHDMNTPRSPHEQKKNTTKKNQEEEKIADYAALPPQSSKLLKAPKPYYDMIASILDVHGGRNADIQKMLEGKATKKQYAECNLAPAMDLAEFTAWGKWAKQELGRYIPKSPANLQSSIMSWRQKQNKQSPTLQAVASVIYTENNLATDGVVTFEKKAK